MKLPSDLFLALVPYTSNYFRDPDSTEVPAAIFSEYSHLDQSRQTGRIAKTYSSSRTHALLCWIYQSERPQTQ